jgi:hypothetical protein
MPDEKKDALLPTLELEIGHGAPVDMGKLAAAANSFSKLLNAVSDEYTGSDHGVRWTVDAKPGSVCLTVQPEARAHVNPLAMQELPEIIASGIADLEREPVRPEFYNDRALTQVKALAKLVGEDVPLTVGNGQVRVELTKQLIVNTDKAFGRSHESVGTVEGLLEALTIHGGNEFTIWPSPGKGVKCSFLKSFVSLDDVLRAVGKRVGARGVITTRPNGDMYLEVSSLRILDKGIAADDVRGLLKDREVAD